MAMGVDETLAEADYGIKRMRENATPFNFYFKATLVCLKGAIDYLLEEYNSRYSVGITENEDLTVSVFKDRVKRRNPKAEAFIDAYSAGRTNLLRDAKVAKLIERHGSRDVSVHRRELSKKVYLTLHEPFTATVQVTARDEKGNIVSTRSSTSQSTQSKQPEFEYVLSDWPHDDIPTLCEYALTQIRGFVEDLRRRFV